MTISSEVIREITELRGRIDNIDRPEIPDTNIELDFTSTDYDTKSECNARGLRFSDTDTPFPSSLAGGITSGTWAHSTGNGWQPSSTNDNEGPAIMIPLNRGGNWQINLCVDLSDATAGRYHTVQLGYVTASGHVGAVAQINDQSANVRYQAKLQTNDGDDTFTVRYTGTALDGAAAREIRFRCLTGCVSVWDDQDDAWHDYEGLQSTGIAYTPTHAYIQVIKLATQSLSEMYISSVKLLYLT
jgi:hypothetical protein